MDSERTVALVPLAPEAMGAWWSRLMASLPEPAMLFTPEWRDVRPREDETYFLIQRADDVLGVLRCRSTSPSTRVFGAGLYPEWRGKRLATALRDAALAQCFTDPSVHKVEIAMSSGNAPTLATHERHGRMQVEGRQRQTIKVGETFYDRILLGITRPEWEAQEADRA